MSASAALLRAIKLNLRQRGMTYRQLSVDLYAILSVDQL
jgi:hypothetical protein